MAGQCVGLSWRQQGQRLTRDREAPYLDLMFLADVCVCVAGRDDGDARDGRQRVREILHEGSGGGGALRSRPGTRW